MENIRNEYVAQQSEYYQYEWPHHASQHLNQICYQKTRYVFLEDP